MKRLSDMMAAKRTEPGASSHRRVVADQKTVFFLAEKGMAELYGVRGRENVSPRYWKNGKLFLSCRSPLWANELWITRESLRERINRELGYEGVKEIKTTE
jgi:hypothetical protein